MMLNFKIKKVLMHPEKVKNTEELLHYLQANLNSNDFAMFTRLVTLMNTNHISRYAFVKKLQFLLRHKPEAFPILNRFFPEDRKIKHKKPRCYNYIRTQMAESIELVNALKKMLRDDVTRFKRFLGLMEKYRAEEKTTREEVYEEVYDLFDGDDDVMKMVGSVFGLSGENFVYLPEKDREPTREFDPVWEAARNIENYAGAVMPPLIEYRLSDVLNNSVQRADNISIQRRRRLGYGLFVS